ncbi:unnamed protein product, partial [Laminaria digitata]
VCIEITEKAAIVDHTACEAVFAVASAQGTRDIFLQGLDEMASLGRDKESLRLQRESRLSRVAR